MPKKKKKTRDPMKRIMEELEKYDEGTEPQSIRELGCSCLNEHEDE